MPSDTPRDRQRRAMFAKMNQPSRSNIMPNIVKKNLKERFLEH